MPASKKLELSYKLDDQSSLANWIEWYEDAHRTTNPDTGRKRKGNAKKVLLDFLENSVKVGAINPSKEEQKKFLDSLDEFKEDTKLPKELQKAKNNLSPEEFQQFKSLFEKSEKEEAKNKTGN